MKLGSQEAKASFGAILKPLERYFYKDCGMGALVYKNGDREVCVKARLRKDWQSVTSLSAYIIKGEGEKSEFCPVFLRTISTPEDLEVCKDIGLHLFSFLESGAVPVIEIPQHPAYPPQPEQLEFEW